MTTLMKDSGIDWIGEIPEGWKVKRLKDISKISTGNTPPRINDCNFSKNKKEGVKWIKPENLNNNLNILIEETKEYITKQGEQYIKIFEDNSIIMSGIGDVGKIGLSNGRFSTNQQNHIVHNIKGNYKFLSYYILSSNFRLKSISSGTVVPILNATNFKLLECVVPPLETQQKIAEYLDVEVSKLDKQVSLLERKYALLGDYKDALIFETVTQGINKNVAMKDSGIDWIGKIPEGWKKGRLKDTLKLMTKSNFPAGDSVADGDYTFYVSGQKTKKINKTNLKKDAILIATGGRFITHYNKNSECAYSTDVLAIGSKKENLSYLYYFIKARENMFNDLYFSGMGIKHLQRNDFLGCQYVYPSLKTQQEIADYLDVEVAKLDKQRELIKRKVELLKEYKEALIFEVVTGKKEVK